MQNCARCGHMLEASTPRQILDGKILCTYCHWKLTTGSKPRVPAPLINLIGEQHADTLPEGNGSGSVLHNERNPDSPPDSQSSVQEQPRALHWTSNQ